MFCKISREINEGIRVKFLPGYLAISQNEPSTLYKYAKATFEIPNMC